MSQRHPVQNDVKMLITTVTAKRVKIFADSCRAMEAIACLYRVQAIRPFFLYGFVIMPDHCHFLMKVPIPETVAQVMASFKSGVTFDLGLPKVWQSRFHLRVPDYPFQALRYIHSDPVRQGMVDDPRAYPWSSASGKWDVSPMEDE